MPEKERIAHHEAGHAVVQTLLGRGRFVVTEVSIVAGAACVGAERRVQGRTHLGSEADLNLYEFGLATMAGIAAENRYFEEHPPTDGEQLWGAVGDIDEWESACRRLYPEEGQARLVGLNVMRKLREIFNDPAVWHVVQELAGALVAHDTVAGEELQGQLARLADVRITGK
jgi:hypothetical protein